MESTPYSIINVCNLNAKEKLSVVDFDIFYEDNYKNNDEHIIATCVGELNKWHKTRYGSDCPYKIDFDEQDVYIIKYKNKLLHFTLTISKKRFVLDKWPVEGYNVYTTVQYREKIENDKDYENFVNLTKKICEVIIRENKESNDDYNEEQRQLCATEYAMDHC